MSKIENNPLMKGASGMLGGVVVYREVRGRTIMSNRPKRSRDLTAGQLGVRNRFLAGVAYAKSQMANEVTKAWYQERIGDRFLSAYAAAMADFLKPPVVHSADTSRYSGAQGSVIEVMVTDDFEVTAVNVEIRNGSGATIESGEAVLEAGKIAWLYTVQTAHTAAAGTVIVARAKDRPGNVTVKEIVVA